MMTLFNFKSNNFSLLDSIDDFDNYRGNLETMGNISKFKFDKKSGVEITRDFVQKNKLCFFYLFKLFQRFNFFWKRRCSM